MNKKLWYLKKLNLFRMLSPEMLHHISQSLVMKEYGKRQVILEPEDKNKVFILKQGRVEIYELTIDGKKIIVDSLSAGHVFGDLGINEGNGHFIEATTNSLVCEMGKDSFFAMVSEHPSIANTLVKELFAKMVEAENQIAALASDNPRVKFKNLLLRLGKRYGQTKANQVVVGQKFTHEELSEMIGISRPTLTSLLNKLAKEGIIKRQGKIISYFPQKLLSL